MSRLTIITEILLRLESADAGTIAICAIITAPFLAVILEATHARGLKRLAVSLLTLPLLIPAAMIACYRAP